MQESASLRDRRTQSNQLKWRSIEVGVEAAKNDSNKARGGGAEGGTLEETNLRHIPPCGDIQSGRNPKTKEEQSGRKTFFSFKNKYHYTYPNTYIALYHSHAKLPVTHTHTHTQRQEIVNHPS